MSNYSYSIEKTVSFGMPYFRGCFKFEDFTSEQFTRFLAFIYELDKDEAASKGEDKE